MRQAQRGFTLVETMVGIAVFAIVSLVMISTFLVGYKTISTEARIISADTAVSEASLSLVRDLNSATTLVAGTISTTSTVTLAYGSPAVTVVYSVDARGNLIRTVNGSPRVAARTIRNVVITVSGCYATVTIQPSATGATASTLNVSNRPGGCF